MQMNYQQSIFSDDNKSVYDKAISRLQFAADVCASRGQEKLYVCYSGGKDSLVLADLCKKANIPFQLHYNITGIDPPEIYRAIKNRGDVIMHGYEKSMWQLIVEKKMPPTRIMRYCCSELKEHGGDGQLCATGVRWAESTKRKGRRPYEVIGKTVKEKILFNDNDEGRLDFENCAIKQKLVTNAIIDWSDDEIWYYIKHEKLDYCKLYDCGYKRLGCIGCPMASTKEREKQFKDNPGFKALYIRAFDKMLINRSESLGNWKTGEDVFNWWLYRNESCDIIDGQLCFFNNEEDEIKNANRHV